MEVDAGERRLEDEKALVVSLLERTLSLSLSPTPSEASKAAYTTTHKFFFPFVFWYELYFGTFFGIGSNLE